MYMFSLSAIALNSLMFGELGWTGCPLLGWLTLLGELSVETVSDHFLFFSFNSSILLLQLLVKCVGVVVSCPPLFSVLTFLH